MRETTNVFEALRAKGEEFFGAVSAELMANPRFMKAVETAWKGKARLDETVAQALKGANIPTRTEFKSALRRLDALDARVQALESAVAKPVAKPKRRAARPRPKRAKTAPVTPGE